MTTQAPSSTQILRLAEGTIRRALPTGWTIDIERRTGAGTDFDATAALRAPNGEVARFAIEVKRQVTTSSLMGVLERFRQLGARPDGDELPFLVATYLSPRAREVLVEQAVSYADTTGNLRVMASRPGLFLETTGASKDPSPDEQPLRSLRGRGAGRAVRALVDFRPPFGVRELAARAKVPAATLSRVIELMEREAVITRDERGGVAGVDWASAIRRWSQEYELRQSNAVLSFLEPRGLDGFAAKLGQAKIRYAVTSSLAAQGFSPIAPVRTAVVYVDDAIAAAGELGLRSADAGANVLLVEPRDEVIFERTSLRRGLVTAAPSQVVVDLLTGPGREPSEGEELIEWMKGNENAWRT